MLSLRLLKSLPLFCAVFLVAIGTAPAAPRVTAPVTAAKYGASIVVRGTGLPANARGVIRIGGVDATTIRTGRGGSFLARFRVPLVTPGKRRLVVRVTVPGSTTIRRASIDFTIRRGMARVDHVVWILMENKNYEQIIGAPDSPYMTSLASRYGNLTNMSAETHPSLRNYIAMTSGTMQDALADSGPPTAHPLDIDSIFGQLKGDWRALQDGMPQPCMLANSGTYAVRHNPATYYTRVRSECAARNVALSDPPDLRAKFTFVTADLCNGTHDCAVSVGDAWLAGFVPQVLASREYRSGRTVVFVTWDESDQTPANHIATVVIAPTVNRVSAGAAFNHYAMLRTTEELLGLPFLGFAKTAPSMRNALGL